LISIKSAGSLLKITHLLLTFYDLLNIIHSKRNEFSLANQCQLYFYKAKYQNNILVFYFVLLVCLVFVRLLFLHWIQLYFFFGFIAYVISIILKLHQPFFDWILSL